MPKTIEEERETDPQNLIKAIEFVRSSIDIALETADRVNTDIQPDDDDTLQITISIKLPTYGWRLIQYAVNKGLETIQ
jgi:hypothetical protein